MFSMVSGIYVMFVLCLMTISTIASIIILFFHYKEARTPVPRWAKRLFLHGLSRVLCMHSGVKTLNNKGANPTPADDELGDSNIKASGKNEKKVSG